MARPRSTRRTTLRIDEAELAAFRAGLRRRYSDEDILGELRAAAERLGRSPTMREFAADPQARVHPQTVIEHFGTWNAAKRAAGLFPRRFSTREELLEQLRRLGEELGRTPTARDLAARRRSLPSASLYAHTFGSLAAALREGRLAGAAVDVFAEEPPPAGHPLYGVDNVIVSPHVSGFMAGYDAGCVELFAENLRRFLDGRPLLNLVDRARGY